MEPAASATSTEPGPARRATIADWLREPEEKGAELLGGRILYKAHPAFEHGQAQRKLGEYLGPFDRRPAGAGKPGGWWISTEVDIELCGEGVRPDLAGWRRDRLDRRPGAGPDSAVLERPDWVGEVLSPSTASRDLGQKLALYHRAQVPHYWIIDPSNQTLTVYRWSADGYVVVLGAGKGEAVRAEPFEAIELRVELLFGDGEEEPAEPSPNPT